MREKNVKKIPSITTVEINGKRHDFYNDHEKHPQIEEINIELDKLMYEIKQAGYKPDTKWVNGRIGSQIDEEFKQLLGRHSEKIALAHAFISLPEGSTIVMKINLRMCGDCFPLSYS